MNNIEHDKISPLIGQFQIKDNYLYVTSDNYNGLFQMDMNDGWIKSIAKFENQENYAESLFDIDIKNDMLFFIPVNADEVAVYDLKKREMCEVLLNKRWGKNIFTSTHIFAKMLLWMFPACGNSILAFDYKQKKICMDYDIRKMYEKKFGESYQYFCANGIYCYDDVIYVACWEKPYLVGFHMKSEKVQFYEIPDLHKGFSAFHGKGYFLYALSDEGQLIVWNLHTQMSENVIHIEDEVKKKNEKYYRKMYDIEDALYLFPYDDVGKALKVALRGKNEVSHLSKSLMKELEDSSAQNKFLLGYVENDRLYGYTYANQYFSVDLKNEKLEWIKCVLYDYRKLKHFIYDQSMLLKKQEIIRESHVVSLKDFIHTEELSEKKIQNAVNIGGRIYHTLI